MHSPKTDASLYLLTCLLQRLERYEPGLLEEMLDGVKDDESTALEPSRQVANRAHLEAVFEEAKQLLEQAINQGKQ